ncbi:HAD-superfamily hydrolase [Candidatus Magnetomorum sp. HK-1]|nr:HAD-superfamily hydrolase [Candidatus Magnetomorum sp. HK-1]
MGIIDSLNFKAIIFDLFGTLTPAVSINSMNRLMEKMARNVAIDPKKFRLKWFSISTDRILGVYKNFDEAYIYVCSLFGIYPDANQIEQAKQIRFSHVQDSLYPREGALEILHSLKKEGLKIGLISDAFPEQVILWSESPFPKFFDTVVFSCVEKVKKPSSKIYRIACERLSVCANQCIYVGDGGSNELSGASQMGMKAILLEDIKEKIQNIYRAEGEQWNGLKISQLCHLKKLIMKYNQ